MRHHDEVRDFSFLKRFEVLAPRSAGVLGGIDEGEGREDEKSFGVAIKEFFCLFVEGVGIVFGFFRLIDQ